jgi:hypothetical protein
LGQCSGQEKPKFSQGNTEAVYDLGTLTDIYEIFRAQTYNATYSQEPNDCRKGLTKLLSIGSLNAVDCNSLKEFETNVHVEDSGYTDRTKKPDKDCLGYIFDLVN